MSLAEKFQRLVRIIPGVAGYQDSEAARETDKAVRMKLAGKIEQIKLDLENEKRRLMEINDLSLLPALDRIASKLDKSANTIKYAARGFSGIFDKPGVDLNRLEKLCSFDLGLFEDADKLKALAKSVHDSYGGSAEMKNAIGKMDGAVDEFGRKFSTRQDILDAQG